MRRAETVQRVSRRTRRAAAAIASSVLLLATPLPAAVLGHLDASVVDAAGRPRPGVRVELASPDLIGEIAKISDSEGAARFPALPPGTYRVTVEGLAPRDGLEAEVVQGRITRVELRVPELGSSVEVVSRPALQPSATVSAHLELDEVRSLPLTREPRAYAQLVPGVSVVPSAGGTDLPYEPASKAGNFYHDRGAQLGSRDNTYLVDGFDTTDMGGGTASLTFHHEAIRSQEVVTSLVPARFPGGAGYVVNLLTRSGGPSFEGSASFFLQEPWMADGFDTGDDRLHTVREDRWDAGFSLGGPVIEDRWWFHLAAQQRENSDDVELSSSATPNPETATFRLRRRNVLLKTTARLSDRSTVVASFFSDPRETFGSRNVNTPPRRDSEREDTPRTWQLSFHRVFGSSGILELRWWDHEREIVGRPTHPEEGPRNTLLFPPGVSVPSYERQLGSAGDGSRVVQRKDQLDLVGSFRWELAGDHEVQLGARVDEWQEENSTNPVFGFSLSSLAPSLAGLTFAEARDLDLLPPSELDTIHRVLANDPGSAAFAHADADGDGVLTFAEVESLRFGSTAGNAGGVNFLRRETALAGVNNVRQKQNAVFVQDDWRLDRWTFTLGLRIEDREYVASDGSTILDMDPTLYPRVGVAWSLPTRRSQVLSLGYGRYSDPLLTPMTRFAGNLSGSVFEDQVWIGGDWYAYRTRGRADLPRDAGFAPNLENERETEVQLTWRLEASPRFSVLAEAWYREDDRLIEDYDPNVYLNPDVAGELALEPETFGYPPEGPGSVNFFLANLVGGRREIRGLDLALDGRFRDGTGSLQYSWRDSEGNSNSNAAADLQGDFLALDPRQPWMTGRLPGTIEHQVKAFGSWRLPFDVEIGGLFYWNSGAVFTEADVFRPQTHGIYFNHQRDDGSWAPMGGEEHPSYWTLDLRARTFFDLGGDLEVQLFLDVFNVFDRQDPIRVTEAHNHPEFTVYREPRLLLEPRSVQAGLRLGF